MFYDEAGNRVKEVLPENYNPATDDGPGTTYKYDNMNRLEEVKDALGKLILRNTYDTNGLVTSRTDESGFPVEYTYDIGNRLKTITTPEAKLKGRTSESYAYDAMGNVISRTDGENNTTTYQRDNSGRLLKVTDPYTRYTSYTYDSAGNVVSVTDANTKTTYYTYNSLNKLASITDPLTQTITYKYDKEGRLKQEKDRNGQIIQYQYNIDNRITYRGISGKEEWDKYLYRKDGTLSAAINPSVIDMYEYRPNGLLKKKIRNGKDLLTYDYDKNGYITKVTDNTGASTGYTYDPAGKLNTVRDGDSTIATYNYNNDNTLANIIYNTGISVTYGYYKDKNITSLVNKNPQGGVIGSYAYTYDNNGNQLSKTENGVTTSYTYDKVNRLLTAGNESYQYDYVGNRQKKTVGTEVTNYYYDARNKLTQSTSSSGTTTYGYDNNGNLLTVTEGSKVTKYTYDGFNRLVDSTMPDGSYMMNIYDPENLRMAVYENGSRYDFTTDRGSVIVETDKAGKLVSRNIRGINLIAQKDANGTLSYYLHNAHGDVVNLVNGSGEVQNSYTYDAFGNTLSYAEKVSNRFMYAGEQFDKLTGQYYLRARHYQPGIGRFIQEDSYRGRITDPLSLHLYTYCHNNPIKYIDPSGHRNEDSKCEDSWGTANIGIGKINQVTNEDLRDLKFVNKSAWQIADIVFKEWLDTEPHKRFNQMPYGMMAANNFKDTLHRKHIYGAADITKLSIKELDAIYWDEYNYQVSITTIGVSLLYLKSLRTSRSTNNLSKPDQDTSETPQVVMNNEVGNSFDVYVEATKLKGVAEQDLLRQQEVFLTPDVEGKNFVKPDYSIYNTNGYLAAIGDAKTSPIIPYDEQAQGFIKAAQTTTSKTIIYYTPTGNSEISLDLIDAARSEGIKIIQIGVW